ncbi:MAG TPA: PDZ domain-containing protein [Fimbriiglobus sp.]|nr:PDZ domain-containing protein [Fimbriiglobus sp.]
MTRWLIALTAAVCTTGLLAAADPPESYEIPYRLTDTKHVLVRAKLNGKGPYNFILDTGAPAVFIPKKLAKEVGVKLDGKGWSTFDRFEVEGGVAVDGARTRVEDLFQLEGMNGLGLAGAELHGVIGYNVLAKYRITYDFTADKLTWVPLDFDPPDPKGIGRGGQGGLEVLGPIMKVLGGLMGINPNFEVRGRGFLGAETEDRKDGVYVKSVLADGPAAKAGIKAGDKFLAIRLGIGGMQKARRIDIDTPRDLARALAEAKSGDELRIEVRRGEVIETTAVTLGGGL